MAKQKTNKDACYRKVKAKAKEEAAKKEAEERGSNGCRRRR